MGQSVTLYRIDNADFSNITGTVDEFGLAEIEKESLTFIKSFEGLRFILSKGQDKETIKLVDKIFYPNTFVGDEMTFEGTDFENPPDDFSFKAEATYYNDPDTVEAISNFLDTITVEKFKSLFDHDELNENDIYPGDIWNTETSDEYAFNPRHMTIEFINLKNFFSEANLEGEYIVSR